MGEILALLAFYKPQSQDLQNEVIIYFVEMAGRLMT